MKIQTGLLALALVLTAQLGLAAAVPPPEKLLPSDMLGIMTVPEYARSKERLSQSPMSRLWSDPAMKPFRERFTGKLASEVIAPLEKEFGIKLADYYGLAQGQMTLGISANGPKGADGEPGLGFVLLIDTREKSSQLQTNLATLRTKWVDSGKQVRPDKIRDVDFTTLIFNSDDFSRVIDKVFPSPNAAGPKDKDADAKGPDKVEWMMGQSGSLFLLGNSAKDLERILVNQSGGSAGALADQSAFAATHNTLLREAVAYGWLDLKTILGNMAKAAGKDQGAGAQAFGMGPDKIMSVLGLNGLQSLSFNLKDSPEGSLLHVAVGAPESGRRGLLKVFAFEAKDSAPPAFIPADTLKFSRLRLDLPKAWDTLETTLSQAIPQIAGVVKMVLDNAGKDQDPNFDLRKNLIQNLGDDIISIEKAPRKQTMDDLGAPPSLTLISSPRPDQLASSIRALTALMPSQASKYKEREFLGRKVYALSLPASMGGAGGKPVERTLHYAASGGYVALTTDLALLEEYLRSNDGSGKPLRELPGLAEAAQKVGGLGTGFFTFENQRETTRAEIETLKKESGSLGLLLGATPFGDRLGMGDGGKLKEWIDLSLLPPYEQISKYFYHTVTGGAVTPDGFSVKIFSATPPELKK
jgi:hypothetical protein